MNKLIVITGQTATGKSSYAYNLAKESRGELINCDSRQVYKYLDIVTGKVIFNDVVTHLVDIADPKEPFSSAQWADQARNAIQDITKRGKTPIIVGGTYLYLKNLLYGFETEHIRPDWKLRSKLEELSVEQLQKRLKQLNKNVLNRMNRSDQHNPRRLMRKIEIVLSSETDGHPGDPELVEGDSRIWLIGLRFKDEVTLRQIIEERVHERLKKGAIEETQQLLNSGYTKTNPGLQTIGYKQIIQFLEDNISQEAMIQLWITAEVQYAKRQYTFMKKDSLISWIEI